MNGRILIVDDEEIVIRSCLRILAAENYEVDTSNDGLDALGKIHEKNYDVLILDIKMPKMDGMEVLQRVKEARPDHRCHHDHRPARYRNSRAGHENGRLRLSAQALRTR